MIILNNSWGSVLLGAILVLLGTAFLLRLVYHLVMLKWLDFRIRVKAKITYEEFGEAIELGRGKDGTLYFVGLDLDVVFKYSHTLISDFMDGVALLDSILEKALMLPPQQPTLSLGELFNGLEEIVYKLENEGGINLKDCLIANLLIITQISNDIPVLTRFKNDKTRYFGELCRWEKIYFSGGKHANFDAV